MGRGPLPVVTALTSFPHTVAPALYGYPCTTSKFPSPNQVWPHPLFCWYIFSWDGEVPRQRTVNITGYGSATLIVHVTGLGLADLVEEPAGLKRNRKPKLPSEVAPTMKINRAALIEPEPEPEPV